MVAVVVKSGCPPPPRHTRHPPSSPSTPALQCDGCHLRPDASGLEDGEDEEAGESPTNAPGADDADPSHNNSNAADPSDVVPIRHRGWLWKKIDNSGPKGVFTPNFFVADGHTFRNAQPPADSAPPGPVDSEPEQLSLYLRQADVQRGGPHSSHLFYGSSDGSLL